jgi:hypothetical protein
LVRAVSRIEAAGGVRRAEAAIDPDAIAAAHAAAAVERNAALPTDHTGPRPYGGVGGTRQGVKCLHAHLANLLAGAADPIGQWTLEQLIADGVELSGLVPSAAAPQHAIRRALPARMTPITDGTAPLDAGSIVVHIDDERVTIAMVGGGEWTLPLGPTSLLDGALERADPPKPYHLTNALGIVHDHFDDVIRMSPSLLATPAVAATGTHVEALARVELGGATIPAGYRLARADADEVFRTLVAEPIAERRFNPGLDEEHVETIVATLCIVLTIMRRLDLDGISITTPDHPVGSTDR